MIAAIPFLIWDFVVTNRHWFFTEKYTLGIRIFSLPIEEIMFFFTVPFACLFTWQMVKKFSKSSKFTETNKSKNLIVTLVLILILAGSFISMIYKKEYTAISLLFISASILIDNKFGANIFTTKTFWIYFGFVSFFTLIFNGFLTWRPIVTYDDIYQLRFRIFTIPIEDFLFGYALMIFTTTIFEKQIRKELSSRTFTMRDL
jgi:lycopene cyclase domain-containing protein